MNKIKLLLMGIVLVMSVGFSPVDSSYVYAGEDDDEEITPGDPPAPRSWACRNLGGLWCWIQ